MAFNFDDIVAFEVGYNSTPRYNDAGCDTMPGGTGKWIEAIVVGFHPVDRRLICIEYKSDNGSLESVYIWSRNLKRIYKCECGAEKLYGKRTGHSSWCLASKNIMTIR